MSTMTGTLAHALLGLLAERARTGYGLLKHFEQSLGYAWLFFLWLLEDAEAEA